MNTINFDSLDLNDPAIRTLIRWVMRETVKTTCQHIADEYGLELVPKLDTEEESE